MHRDTGQIAAEKPKQWIAPWFRQRDVTLVTRASPLRFTHSDAGSLFWVAAGGHYITPPPSPCFRLRPVPLHYSQPWHLPLQTFARYAHHLIILQSSADILHPLSDSVSLTSLLADGFIELTTTPHSFAIFLPPVGVFFERGCNADFVRCLFPWYYHRY